MTEREVGSGNERDGGAINQDAAPYLLVRLDGRTLAQVPVRDGLRIGRGQNNDLVLPGTRSARYHARIDRQGDYYVLSNVGSQNHTWVNGISLIGQRRLRHGDRIVLGDVELVFLAEPFGSAAESKGAAAESKGAAAESKGAAPESKGSAAEPPVATRSPDAGASVPALGFNSRAALRSGVTESGTENGPSTGGEPGTGDKPRRRRRAYSITPAGVVVLLMTIVLAAYFLIPGLFEPQPSTPEPTATPTAATPTPLPSPTNPPAPTPSATAALRSTPISTDDRLSQAESLALKSQFEEAIEIYQAVALEHPDDARPEIGWAWALLLDGWPDQALLHARRASELAPQSVEAAIVLARAYVEVQETDRALSWAQRAGSSAAGNAEAQAVLALALLLDGRAGEAVEEGALAVQSDPRSAEAHRTQGLLYQEIDGDPQRAVEDLQVAAQLRG